MEAHGQFGRAGGRRSSQALTNRRNAALIALLSAVLAGVLIYLFVSHYRKTAPPIVEAPTQETVFVAKHTIPIGTPQSTITAENLLKPVQKPISQAVPGAITDPSAITGEVTAKAISQLQQVTASDFSHSNVTIASYLSGDWRAIAVALDSWHGLSNYLRRGDTVDVMGQKGKKSEMLFQDVTVLGNTGGNVVLKLTDDQSLKLSDDIGDKIQIWLTLRPVTGANDSVPAGKVVTPDGP